MLGYLSCKTDRNSDITADNVWGNDICSHVLGLKTNRKLIKKRLAIASQRSVSPDGTWLKRDIQSIMSAGLDMMDLIYILYLQ